jgi:hypothetical protein
VVFEFTNPYGGIPQNLLFNVIGYAVLILLFALLRRAAGNYGRLVSSGQEPILRSRVSTPRVD